MLVVSFHMRETGCFYKNHKPKLIFFVNLQIALISRTTKFACYMVVGPSVFLSKKEKVDELTHFTGIKCYN